MTELQNKIIHQYKSLFPQDTLKTISSKTGIQVTRVFRLLNGSEMKLSEFKAFEESIRQVSKGERKRLLHLVEDCLHEFNDKQIKRLFLDISQRKSILNFKKEQAYV